MKKNWIIITILFLLAANAALLSTLIVTNKNASVVRGDRFSREHPRKNGSSGPFERHLMEQLGLNEEQLEDIRHFRDDFHAEKHDLILKSEEMRREYFQQFSSNMPDSSSMQSTAKKIGELYTQMMLLDFEHYRNIRSVCNEEQKRTMDSLGRSKMEIFKNKRETPGMQWRQKHKGNRPFNNRQHKFNNHENN